MVRATKKILECPEYEFLLQLKRSIYRRLKTLALPGEILRAGVYPVSVGMVEAVEKTLEDFSVRWGVGVLRLEQVWDLRVREVEDRRYEDCPLPDVVRLLERPEGTMPIHRLHDPLAGCEQTAKALRLLLREQLATDKETEKPVADGWTTPVARPGLFVRQRECWHPAPRPASILPAAWALVWPPTC
jgi:hypothetical protein